MFLRVVRSFRSRSQEKSGVFVLKSSQELSFLFSRVALFMQLTYSKYMYCVFKTITFKTTRNNKFQVNVLWHVSSGRHHRRTPPDNMIPFVSSCFSRRHKNIHCFLIFIKSGENYQLSIFAEVLLYLIGKNTLLHNYYKYVNLFSKILCNSNVSLFTRAAATEIFLYRHKHSIILLFLQLLTIDLSH